MNIVLLSGGSGKRLWPLSNDVRSRQFLRLFKGVDGSFESMIQRVYRQIKEVDSDAMITVATSKTQVSAIHNQLGNKVNVCIEPTRKNTFPVIALTASYLHDVKKISPEEIVVVCPIDPYVENDYFFALQKLETCVREQRTNLALLGITPEMPSDKYGYIIPMSMSEISDVRTFKEKPNIEIAKQYIEGGALWNGGVFAFRLKYILDKVHEMVEFTDFEDLYDQYDKLPSISFDYAIVEKEKNLKVLKYNGIWKDLSTWDTLCEEMDDNIIGQAIHNDQCQNISIINELNVPILCMGLEDVVISASAEGILVSNKKQSKYIEPYVDDLSNCIMFAEKSWGDFRVLDVEDGSMTVKATLNAGYGMRYHSHDHRDEVWTIISGTGRTIVDGMEEIVGPGDVITMEAGCKHTIIADTKMQLIEVQLGKEINVHDKRKYELEG